MLNPTMLHFFVKESSRDYFAATSRPDPMRIRHAPDKSHTRLSNYRFTPKEYISEMERRYGSDPAFKDLVAERKALLQNQIRNTPSLNKLDMVGGRGGQRAALADDSGAHFDPKTQRTITRNKNPLILGHEVGHAEDFHKRVGASGKTSLTLNEKRRGVKKTRTTKGEGITAPYRNAYQNSDRANPFDFTTPERLQDAKARRNTLRNEREATKNVLERYDPWVNRNSKKMTPSQRENVAQILAAQTTYWDEGSASARKSIRSTRNQKRGKRLTELVKSDNPTIAERAERVLGQEVEAGNPFKQKGKWAKMNKKERKAYIEHIKEYANRIENNFGKGSGKLYKSEMMRKLRGML